MTFKESLQILGIEKYAERIYNSNSHGELLHLQDYIRIAIFLEKMGKTEFFYEWFEDVVTQAEKNWERPESIFQHIDKIFTEQLSNVIEK